jgi:hypothetical protein
MRNALKKNGEGKGREKRGWRKGRDGGRGGEEIRLPPPLGPQLVPFFFLANEERTLKDERRGA